VPGARAALDRLRAAGVRLGVVSNQSGVARGLVGLAAAAAAGARGVLVPTAVTRRAEIDAAAVVARNLGHAVDLILGGALGSGGAR
jgi:phosphoglycolate phosphatase-like HAD superfamily hydrolase